MTKTNWEPCMQCCVCDKVAGMGNGVKVNQVRVVQFSCQIV